jgi:hypothetical protein
LVIIADKEMSLLLLYNGLILAMGYFILSTIPSLFEIIYGFDEIKLGLIYIPLVVIVHS